MTTLNCHEGNESQSLGIFWGLPPAKKKGNLERQPYKEKDNDHPSVNQNHQALAKVGSSPFVKMGSINYLIGKRRSGKHVLLRSLYSSIADQIEEFFVFTDNEAMMDDRYQEFT